MEAVYRIDGKRIEVSGHAAGPWDPTMQHGGGPAALVAWAAEAMPSARPMQIARLTIDLMRPVPVAPLAVETEVFREGRKIQLCGVRLLAAGVVVVRASVLKIRASDDAPPAGAAALPLDVARPEQLPDSTELRGSRNPFLDGVTLRVARGAFRQPGPASVWFRPDRSIVAGAPTSPVMRTAIAADVCAGVSAMLDFRQWTYVNADLTISLARQPVGEWILLDAETWLGPAGSGVAAARLGDLHGYFGRALQSIVVERR